ncbi:glutamate-5-semialdehyde dehydrogenase [Acetitomaculum ruminis DSM 5522]|uniref:Gamma-glutamyl phosphate reductase n=1 Tax=Acetitomaculum ruminis DSM 5522 TaxID=1120918 RepID=A0A1I0VJG6_9FIRM|nr:glutamate-5-semialdehyde dehydrogenase [Acetitomaculum ruminis]SFA76167.1 glutamate-5-semialdehyde dehydrogenase [Acetitomaculum ruminis DSM 5522]
MFDLNQVCENAKEALKEISILGIDEKNDILRKTADALVKNSDEIIEKNKIDVENGVNKGMKQSLIDRLSLNKKRIEDMALGLKQIATLDDPIGGIDSMVKRPNGLLVGKKRVPLGVVGIIYEARPNVTADAFGLCFKTGNVVILKGGSDAINSNIAIVDSIRGVLKENGINPDAINLITATDHETTTRFMKMNDYVDVLIPRGGAGLIKNVVLNSTIPVIETGTGNCHIYVDETADIDMAANIIVNAKTQRTGVCNACESLVIHKNIAQKAIPVICNILKQKGVEIRGDKTVLDIYTDAIAADEEDWGKEYLDLIISIKTVENIDEAISHINKYNSGHSESIITKDYANAQKFLERVDAAAVYVNASTRFTDGFEFGFGAEIGISTQKLHARGPMGLDALTTYKYIIYGDGQIRP